MSDVLNPVRSVTIRGTVVEVTELKWKDYTRAVKELSASLLKLVGPNGQTINLDRELIIETITAQEELLTWVLQKATGQSQSWVDDLTAKEAIALVQVVVDLNLSLEVISGGKALAGQMGKVFGLKNKLPGPWTTSSAPATPTQT